MLATGDSDELGDTSSSYDDDDSSPGFHNRPETDDETSSAALRSENESNRERPPTSRSNEPAGESDPEKSWPNVEESILTARRRL
jgi:hypothetical protein